MKTGTSSSFVADCVACPRLANHLKTVRQAYPSYHAAPVAPFGPDDARLLIVGLAPGLHGANATGRPFTGDYAGILLYQTLFDHGFANQPTPTHADATRDERLQLRDCRISNAVKCLPPANKPTTAEIRQCNGYLAAEITDLQPQVILSLGHIAHRAVLQALQRKPSTLSFAHGAWHDLGTQGRLVNSYHCSRYNTQTRRLTPAMFSAVIADIRQFLGPC